MNITGQIRISLVISFVFALVISGSIIYTYETMQVFGNQEDLAAEVVRGGYELNYLFDDYLINSAPRAYTQWEERYNSLQPIISQLNADNNEEEHSIDSIKDYNVKIGQLFLEIPKPELLNEDSTSSSSKFKQITWIRSIIQLQGLIFEALQLRHLFNNEVKDARFKNNMMVIILIFFILAVININYLLISRRLMNSIKEINVGSDEFASGNLKYKIPILSNDEIGGIAGRLNLMAEQIRLVTSSRDELNREIEIRQKSEAQREALLTELKQINAELDRFTYTVSHDLKSPLITIQGFLGYLGKDIKEGKFELVEEDIKRISLAVEKMEKMISTLLELSRSGKSVDNPSRINFNDLIQEAVFLLDNSLKKAGIELIVSRDLPDIFGDRVRLLQMITNLLENAVKFMGTQKKPVVEVGVIYKGTDPVFFVHDNGQGIRKDDQSKIFRLFERLNLDIPGTGIGLATAKRIVEAHGGVIWVESEGEGKGTRIFFSLPDVSRVK